MTIGRILFLMSALAFSQAGMANHQASDKNSAADKMWVLDVDKQLEYCHKQVGRALDELRQKDGSYDFSMEPRNILKGDRQKGWNCRKATPEEWCDRFWPCILWMNYQNTKDEAVRKAAEGYTESLKETSDDLVPLWDMDDPRGVKGGAPKDASAACVVADALLELQQYVGGEKGEEYKLFALQSLAQLSTERYQSGKKNVAFLMHSTGHHPAGSEIDASIIYADYYYLEALMRAKALK